ncbi:MAG: MerR family transcriptional regulator [Myxococcota bacterium]
MSRRELLTVGDVAQAAGMAPSAVRYYESIGLLPRPERRGGWRRYDPSVVERIRLIQAATRAGFRLEEAKILLDAMDAGDVNPMAELARARLPELEASLARLQGMVALMRMASDCRCPSLADCAELLTQTPDGPPR